MNFKYLLLITTYTGTVLTTSWTLFDTPEDAQKALASAVERASSGEGLGDSKSLHPQGRGVENMMSDARQLAIAKRCQLLTGSYKGKSRGCPCQDRSQCFIPEGNRDWLVDQPEVIQARERNAKEFEEVKYGSG